MNKPVRIGVFDSGVGGLTVLEHLLKALPNACYDYFGDTARVPYGSRSDQTILDFSQQCLEHLARRGADLLVVACNTSSAVALPRLRAAFDIPVIGVIEDGVLAALDEADEKVLVLGTRATIHSQIYQQRIRLERPELQVRGVACPLFVPIAEEGWADTSVAEAAVRLYLEQCADYRFDLVVLGCTHFPLMKPALRRAVGPSVKIVDPGARVAQRLARLFPAASEFAEPQVHFHVTDSPDGFRRVAQAMGLRVTSDVEHVDLSSIATPA